MIATLDTNCLIAVEKGEEPDASAVLRLDALAGEGLVRLRVDMSAVMERPNDGARTAMHDFAAKLAAIGLSHVSPLEGPRPLMVLLPDGWWGGFEAEHAVRTRLHQLLFPNVPFYRHDFLAAEYRRLGLAAATVDVAVEERLSRKWMNKKNDALGLYSHVTCGGTLFVTSDKNFLNKQKVLRQLVPGEILAPVEALAYVLRVTGASLPALQAIETREEMA